MTTEWTETEHDEQLYEALEAAFAAAESDDLPIETVLPGLFMEHLAPALAAIRRHAAADALKQQAARISKTVTAYNKRAQAEANDSHPETMYSAYAQQARTDARMLLRAAADKLAEGYEHTCASFTWATRSDPGYGCDTPVENEGDYCDRHEPEDDEDRWAD